MFLMMEMNASLTYYHLLVVAREEVKRTLFGPLWAASLGSLSLSLYLYVPPLYKPFSSLLFINSMKYILVFPLL